MTASIGNVAPQSAPLPELPPDPITALSKQFQTSLQDVNKQSGLPADANIDQQVQNFMSLADTSGDLKVNAQELAASLKIPELQAQGYIQNFDSILNRDNALDAREITDVLKAAEQPVEAEETPSGGGSDTKPKEEAKAGEGKPEGGKPEEGKPEESGSAGGSEAPGSAGAGGMSGLSDLRKLLLALLDADGDGKISPQELKKFVEKYDKNGDGKLDKNELKEGLKAEAEEKGVELSDSELEKLTTQIDTLFENADANKDGALDNTELTDSITQLENLQSETPE
jgi:Ca2+-binding EF-hand superfamily protein